MEELELDFCGSDVDAEAKHMAEKYGVKVEKLPYDKWVNGFPVFKFVGPKENLDKLFAFYDNGGSIASDTY